MSQFTSENIQQFVKQAAEAGVDGFKAQGRYFELLVKRNTKVLSSLGSARLSSLKELAGARTFSQAFETNLAFEESVREELGQLHEENLKAWEDLQEQLKSIYTPSRKASEDSAPRKAAPRKAASRKAKRETTKKAA